MRVCILAPYPLNTLKQTAPKKTDKKIHTHSVYFFVIFVGLFFFVFAIDATINIIFSFVIEIFCRLDSCDASAI